VIGPSPMASVLVACPIPWRFWRPRSAFSRFKEAFAAWLATDDQLELAELTRRALDGLRTSATELG